MNSERGTLTLVVIATVLLTYTVGDAIFKSVTLLILWSAHARFRGSEASTGDDASVKMYVFFHSSIVYNL
jgi:hypothetical protein